MAKISNGPLAAGISGKLGPVVFHQTRFGQVVQSKAKTKVWTTPAALAVKAAFRAGPRSFVLNGEVATVNLRAAFDAISRSASGQWNACMAQAARDGYGNLRPVAGSPEWASMVDLSPGPFNGWTARCAFRPGAVTVLTTVHWYELSADGSPTSIVQSFTVPGTPFDRYPRRVLVQPFIAISLAYSLVGLPGIPPQHAGAIGPSILVP